MRPSGNWALETRNGLLTFDQELAQVVVELGLGIELFDLFERSEHQEEPLLAHVHLEAECVRLQVLRSELLQRLQELVAFFQSVFRLTGEQNQVS